MTIWKYVLDRKEIQTIGMPAGASVVTVAIQESEITVWVLCDPSAPVEPRRFAIVGTGQPAPAHDEGAYCGTVFDGPFVWHVFEDVV